MTTSHENRQYPQEAMALKGAHATSVTQLFFFSFQAFWYYDVRFRTIDLKSHPIAQFMKNRIIHKRTHNIHKIKHNSTIFLGIPV